MIDRDDDDDVDDLDEGDTNEEGRGGSISGPNDEGRYDDENDDDEEEEEEEDEDAVSEVQPSSSSSSSGVVRVTVRTSLRSPVVDRGARMMSSGKRTILSLRQAVGRTMNMPPSAVRLRLRGVLLDDDDVTVDQILSSRDDEDDDDEDEALDEEDDDDDDDDVDVRRLRLTCDVIPPIESKFGIELRERASKMSTKEILEAYYLNVAGMAYGQDVQMREQQRYLPRSGGTCGDDDDARDGNEDENRSLDVRRRASIVRRQFESSMSDETRRLIDEEHERVIVDRKRREDVSCNVDDDDGEVVFGLIPRGGGGSSSSSSNIGRGRSIKRRGGATMNVKRVLQRNLNVVRGYYVIFLSFAFRALLEENRDRTMN